MACARATCPDATASASPRPRRTATRSTRALRWRIEPAEVVEHEPTLFRRESLQLVPRGVAEPRARARRSRLERGGNVHAVTRRGPALTLLVLVRLVVGEGAAGVEQPVVQALLPLDRPLVRSEEHTSELQSQSNLGCRLLLEKKNIESETLAALARVEAGLEGAVLLPELHDPHLEVREADLAGNLVEHEIPIVGAVLAPYH